MGSTTQPTTYFYEDKPLFGLDIGRGKARVLQLQPAGGKLKVVGYGETSFNAAASTDGTITDPKTVAAAIQQLFKHHLVGDITSRRVAVAVPIAHAFTRAIDVVDLTDREVSEAVRNEVEQYVPAAVDSLYVDHTRVGTAGRLAFIVSMPKQIIDSYLLLTRLLGLEAVAFQTSSGACAQLFSRDAQSDVPSVLVDFGSDSADITIYDNGPIVSGTVASGGEQLTAAICRDLGVTPAQANLIKIKYGLGHSKKQRQIEAALRGPLGLLTKEIKRTIRYYQERSNGGQAISQVMMMGGGANMPGLAEYLTDDMRLPVRSFDPSALLNFGHLQPFDLSTRMSYVTAAGLASITPSELFK